MSLKIYSWNVNGIRACVKNGFDEWFLREAPDILALQEVRAEPHQIPESLCNLTQIHQLWFGAERKGYSGTGILSKEAPLNVWRGMKCPEFDIEGRVLTAEFEKLFMVSAYFPNSQDGGARIKYKVAFCECIKGWVNELRQRGKPVVLSGDFNIAHEAIDLARPKENEESPGYLPEERSWMSTFLKSGWVDSYRALHPESVKYSWWSMRMRARERNVGWRIDYHTVSEGDRGLIVDAGIDDQVRGSDHAPVWVRLQL